MAVYTQNNAIASVAHRLLSERIAEVSQRLATGVAIEDFPQYREQVGVINGLQQAAELIAEAQRMIEER